MEETSTPPEFPLPEDWTTVNVKSLEFICGKAEARLAETNDQLTRLHDRTYRYLAVFSPLMGVLMFTLYSVVSGERREIGIVWILGFLLLAGTYAIFLLARLQRPFPYSPAGREPEELMQRDYLASHEDNPLDTEAQYINLLLGYLTTTQVAIEENEAIGDYFRMTLNRIVIAICGAFILSVLALIVLAFAASG